jgi:P27 family predicted phage terminase small subunit
MTKRKPGSTRPIRSDRASNIVHLRRHGGTDGDRSRADLDGGLKLSPQAPPEPDWRTWFPFGDEDLERRKSMARQRATAREEWRRAVEQLDPHGVLAPADFSALSNYCVSLARAWELERVMSLEGPVIYPEGGIPRAHPAATVLNQLRPAIRDAQQRFGLNPQARDFINGQQTANGSGVAASGWD